jgi:predicted nucleotidyltransferase
MEGGRPQLRSEGYSSCYIALMTRSLRDIAARTDAVVAAAREDLVRAVRRAAADGMTQTQIAREIGRSQPEVSRLLHFHGSSPRALALRRKAAEVRKAVAEAGGSNVRVFGSVAQGIDTDESDIDLLFAMNAPLSLMSLSRLERKLAAIIGAQVDLIPEQSLRPDLKSKVLREAVPL